MPRANGNAEPEDRAGQLIGGKWRIGRCIGRGGMATVYEATHRNGSRVALKILHPTAALTEEQRARFRREGYAANRVGHPGVVRVHDDGTTDDGCPFLVMELLEGRTVGAEAAESGGRLAAQRVIWLGAQLLDVLARAHEVGVLHRDVKPENLFVTTEGKLKVLDFGIARVADGAADQTVTQDGTLLGTPAYSAPEQARCRVGAVDARSDVWAAGATLFTLLSGRFVHVASSAGEQLALAMTTPAPPLQSAAPGAPAALAAVIDRALAFDPADRFPDARSMQQALLCLGERWQDILRDPESFPEELRHLSRDVASPGSTSTFPGGPDGEGTSGRRRPWVRVAGLAALAAALAGLVLARPARRDGPSVASLPAPKQAAWGVERGSPPAAPGQGESPAVRPLPSPAPSPAAKGPMRAVRHPVSAGAGAGLAPASPAGSAEALEGRDPYDRRH